MVINFMVIINKRKTDQKNASKEAVTEEHWFYSIPNALPPPHDMKLPPPLYSPVFASGHPATVFIITMVMIAFTSNKPLGWMAPARQQ